MSPKPSQDPSRRDQDDTFLSGASFSGVYHLSLEGLGRESVEFAQRVASLCQRSGNCKMVAMEKASQRLLKELDLFEWSKPYPDDIPKREFPFFPGDRARHVELKRLESVYVQLKDARDRGEPLRRDLILNAWRIKPPITYTNAIELIDRDIERCTNDLRVRGTRGVSVDSGKMRPTEYGGMVIDVVADKPLDTATQIFRLIIRAEQLVGKTSRVDVLEHIRALWDISTETHLSDKAILAAFDRHLRKFGVAMLERRLSFDPRDLERRATCILGESHVDTYIGTARTREQRKHQALAYKWLQGRHQGQHGTVPYPSWQPRAKEESYNEAHKIVKRARQQSYHAFGRLRMETRALGSKPPVLREFAESVCDVVQGVRADDKDIPPGPGLVMSGLRLEDLFFGARDNRGIERYARDEDVWFADQIRSLEDATIVPLRQWIAVTSTPDDFKLFGERYYYVIDNDHFSGGYEFAYAFPVSVVDAKLRQVAYPFEDGKLSVRDISEVKLSIPDLIEATRQAEKLHLELGHMSVLFGGMNNALPVGSSPVFDFENEYRESSWLDIRGHLHWAWLVWEFREDWDEVEDAVRPLAQADWEIRGFANAGQKLFEAFRHRYGAWKNDQTPTATESPRLLRRAYDIFREHKAKGAVGKSDEAVYVGVQDRFHPNFDPVPVLNCFTLEVKTPRKAPKVRFPNDSDGAHPEELALWRRHVRSLIEDELPNGGVRENQFELVLIGEDDVKRR